MKHFDLKIKIDSFTDLWGKHTLVFPVCSSETANDGLLPFGAVIASATLKVYSGYIDEKTDISTATLVPDIIDGTPIVVSPNKVTFFVQHPGATYANIKATLIVEITLTDGGKNTFYGEGIYIGWSD